jgi:hypothetical protein
VTVGDLVKREVVPYEFSEVVTYYGIVLQLSRTGKKTRSAKVLFNDGSSEWFDTQGLEVISASR